MTHAALIVDRNVPTVGINGFGRIGKSKCGLMWDELTVRPSSSTTMPRPNRLEGSRYQSHRLIPRTSHDGYPPRLNSRSVSSIRRDHLCTIRSPRSLASLGKQPYPFRAFVPGTTDPSILTTRSEIRRLGFGGCCIRHGVNGKDDDERNCQCAHYAWRC
jgi:hypothetical protein